MRGVSEAAVTSNGTPTTEMIARKRGRRRRCYECTSCCYASERKSNVERHYKRIHRELKKHRICICHKTFATKGEYYEHCYEIHPHLSQSPYVNKKKYRQRKPKENIEKDSKNVECKIHTNNNNLPKRKCLLDITNFQNANWNNAQLTNNQYLEQIEKEHRAFISQIDFDMLDAVLNLKYLKNSSH